MLDLSRPESGAPDVLKIADFGLAKTFGWDLSRDGVETRSGIW